MCYEGNKMISLEEEKLESIYLSRTCKPRLEDEQEMDGQRGDAQDGEGILGGSCMYQVLEEGQSLVYARAWEPTSVAGVEVRLEGNVGSCL